MNCTTYDKGCACHSCLHTESIVITNNYPSYLNSPRYQAKLGMTKPASMAGIAAWWPGPPPSRFRFWGFTPPGSEAAKEPPPTVRSKLEPQTCLTCKTINEYAGPEHLQANGTYICRSCRNH